MGVAIRHRHDAGFLQPPDVADIKCLKQRIHKRRFGRAWVAENMAAPLASQHFQQHSISAPRCDRVQPFDSHISHVFHPSVLTLEEEPLAMKIPLAEEGRYYLDRTENRRQNCQ
jgi:hypothetical protein